MKIYLYLIFFDRNFYNFNRSIKDMNPYQIKDFDNYSVLVHNVIGIKEEDLDISIVHERNVSYLEIKGETKNDVLGSTYSVNSRFIIDKDNIKNINYNVEDGLLYITINYKEPCKEDIKITRI